MRSPLLLLVLAGLLAAGCSSRTGTTRGGAQAEPDGIQTRAYGSAPSTRAPAASSKPLSETNSPDAVAARQAQARAEGKTLPGTGYGQAFKAGPTRGEPAAAHDQVVGFEKGAKVYVRAGAALRSRPSSGSDSIQSLVLDDQVTLDTRVYNAEGYWWYVLTGADDGWIAQSDLLQP